jgi:hypothetical protein
MKLSGKLKRNAMLAVAVAAIAAAAIVAAVTSGAGHHSVRSASAHATGQPGRLSTPGDLALAADYLGMTRTQLQKQLQSGQTLAQIANATRGKSAAGLIDAIASTRSGRLSAIASVQKLPPTTQKRMLARLRRRIEAQVNRTDRTTGRLPTNAAVDLAAAYLGVGAQALRGELASGRSLAQIAAATPGKSAAALIDALVSARTAAIKAAAASGKIAQATETALLATARQAITREVDRVRSPTG